MTGRIPLDDMTSDQLDELYDDLDRYEEVQGEMNERAIDLTRRAERAEAAVARVRALHREAYGSCEECTNSHTVLWPCPTIQALDEPVVAPSATEATEEPTP